MIRLCDDYVIKGMLFSLHQKKTTSLTDHDLRMEGRNYDEEDCQSTEMDVYAGPGSLRLYGVHGMRSPDGRQNGRPFLWIFSMFACFDYNKNDINKKM